MRVGFIGAGRMGRPMVGRLGAAGHEVRVLGRTREKRAALAESGATPVAEVTEVADQADVVCVCVFSDDQVREICLDGDLLTAMPAHSVLVIHTTGSPRTAAAIADTATARTRDIGVLDAPVSGGPHDIAVGHITLLVGGDKAHFNRAQPALSAYGDPILHLGPLGNGQVVKLVNNALFAANIGLVTAAARLGGELGIDEKTLLSALSHGSSASRALAGAAARGSANDFATAITEFLGKDVAVVRAVAAEFGTHLGVLGEAIDELAQLQGLRLCMTYGRCTSYGRWIKLVNVVTPMIATPSRAKTTTRAKTTVRGQLAVVPEGPVGPVGPVGTAETGR